jgi:hypothetical protein
VFLGGFFGWVFYCQPCLAGRSAVVAAAVRPLLDTDVVDTVDLAAAGVVVGSSRGSSSAMKAEASSSWNSSEASTDGEGSEEEEGGAAAWRDLSWLKKETCKMHVSNACVSIALTHTCRQLTGLLYLLIVFSSRCVEGTREAQLHRWQICHQTR